jgi:hypothetical protein
MAEVSTRGGGASTLGPAAVLMFHVINSDVSRDFRHVTAALSKELLAEVVRCDMAWVKFIIEELVPER